MAKYSKNDIIRIVDEEDIEFIRLQFTDIFGTLKNVAITASQLEKALDNKCMFDGSSIEGFCPASIRARFPDKMQIRAYRRKQKTVHQDRSVLNRNRSLLKVRPLGSDQGLPWDPGFFLPLIQKPAIPAAPVLL